MSEKETSKETRRVTRVALRPATEKVIEGWRENLKSAFPGFSPSLSELVAWAAERTPVLSKKDLQKIRSLFFDEVKELELLLSQLKVAKSTGDEQSVESLMANISIHRKMPRKSRTQKPEPDRRNEDGSTE